MQNLLSILRLGVVRQYADCAPIPQGQHTSTVDRLQDY